MQEPEDIGKAIDYAIRKLSKEHCEPIGEE